MSNVDLAPSSLTGDQVRLPLYLQVLSSLQDFFLRPGDQGLSLTLPDSPWSGFLSAAGEKSILPPQANMAQGDIDPFIFPNRGLPTQQVIGNLARFQEGKQLQGHPAIATNIIPQPTLASIAAPLWPAMMGPNLCSSESGSPYVVAEQAIARHLALLANWSPSTAQGVFSFGGTGTLLYALRIALERAFPGSLQTGIKSPVAIVCSDHAHHACLRAAAWLGIGQQSVVRIKTVADASMDITQLEQELRRLHSLQIPVAAIIATCGTTDAFGLDSVKAIDELRTSLTSQLHWPIIPYLHADAVIGWSWLFFQNYDFANNPLELPAQVLVAVKNTAAKLGELEFADSFGVDFHKTGFTPYTASLLVLKQRTDLAPFRVSPSEAPYFLQGLEDEPGAYTLETSRSGAGPIMAWASCWQLGTEGFQVLLAHATHMALTLRDMLAKMPNVQLLYPQATGPSVLVRVLPSDKRTDETDAAYQQRTDDLQQSIAASSLARTRLGDGSAWGITTVTMPSEGSNPSSRRFRALKAFCISPTMTIKHLNDLCQAISDFGGGR